MFSEAPGEALKLLTFWGTLAGALFGVLAAVAGFLAWAAGDELGSRTEKLLAETQSRAVDTALQTQEMARVVNGRTITAQEQDAVVNALRGQKLKMVVTFDDDPEAWAYAGQVVSMFEKAGMTVSAPMTPAPWRSINPKLTLTLSRRDPTWTDHSEGMYSHPLYKAINAAQMFGVIETVEGSGPPVVHVGTRPAPQKGIRFY